MSARQARCYKYPAAAEHQHFKTLPSMPAPSPEYCPSPTAAQARHHQHSERGAISLSADHGLTKLLAWLPHQRWGLGMDKPQRLQSSAAQLILQVNTRSSMDS